MTIYSLDSLLLQYGNSLLFHVQFLLLLLDLHTDFHTETETELCLGVSCGGTVSRGLPQGQGLWLQQTWVWLKPSWRRSLLTHHRASRTYTGLGKQTLEGYKRNLVRTRTQEKGAVTPQEMANRHMLRCPTLLILREMQIKTKLRYHLSLIRMTITEKSTNNFWGRCGEKRILLHCW